MPPQEAGICILQESLTKWWMHAKLAILLCLYSARRVIEAQITFATMVMQTIVPQIVLVLILQAHTGIRSYGLFMENVMICTRTVCM